MIRSLTELFFQTVYAQQLVESLPQPKISLIPFRSSVGLNLQNCSAVPDASFLGCYISSFYTLFAQGAIVLAVLMIMMGGFQWLLAAGNASKISQAKSTISAAVFGLILALASYAIFAQINRNLVELQDLPIASVDISLPSSGEFSEIYIRENLRLENIEKQFRYIHPDMAVALNKLDAATPKIWNTYINSIIDDRIFTGQCYRSRDGGPIEGTCSHTKKNSHHYGGPNNTGVFNSSNPPISCAVDMSPINRSYYGEFEGMVKRAGFTFVQCEHTCLNKNPRCGEVLNCLTTIGENGPGTIGHIHAEIRNCRNIPRPSGTGGESGAD